MKTRAVWFLVLAVVLLQSSALADGKAFGRVQDTSSYAPLVEAGAQAIGALGQPLFADPVDAKDVLTYACAGGWYVGYRTLWHGGGLGCAVTLSEGVLDTVYLSNSSVCIQTFV